MQDVSDEATVDPGFAHKCRSVVRGARTATLGTLDQETGHPFTSLVALASNHAGAPLFLLSNLARHTANLKCDPRASCLVTDLPTSGDPLTGTRVSLVGSVVRDDRPNTRNRYLSRHPDAAIYADFADFAFYRFEPEMVHLVAGFGVIETKPASQFMAEDARAGEFEAEEAGAVSHMNEDHLDAIALYAQSLCGQTAGDWRVSGIDMDGFDIRDETRSARITFDAQLPSFGMLRQAFKTLSERARSTAERTE